MGLHPFQEKHCEVLVREKVFLPQLNHNLSLHLREGWTLEIKDVHDSFFLSREWLKTSEQTEQELRSNASVLQKTDKAKKVHAPHLSMCKNDSVKHTCPTEQMTQMAEDMKLKC